MQINVIISVSSIAASQTYANAQKLVALPAYQQQTQAYKTFVGPSTNQASPYTAAYVQPTAISALKVNFQMSILIRNFLVFTFLWWNEIFSI